MNRNLGVYLHDHLAAANLAVNLIEALEQNQRDGSIRAFLQDLLAEVAADRDTLKNLLNEMGSESSIVKDSAALLAAKAANLKLGTGKELFGLFESFEFLALGILGKLHLWKALQLAAASNGPIAHVDYAGLIQRAEAQYAKVERYRLATAHVLHIEP